MPLGAATIYSALQGGWLLVAVASVAALIALHEFYAMARELRPLVPAGFAAVVAGLAAVHHGGVAWAAAPLVAMLVIVFWMSAVAEVRQPAVVQFAATVFGAVWIGLGFVFLVAVRDLPGEHGLGRDLLLAVLLGVWASDVAAFTIGRLFGRRLLAAEISPAKTVEGFLAGLVAGTATVFFTLYREPHGAAALDAPRARVRRRDRARRADRRPARELPQARHGGEGHRDASSAGTAACSTGWTRCCWRLRPPTSWRSPSAAPDARRRRRESLDQVHLFHP